MAEGSKSPAVQALEIEQAKQREQEGKGDLDKALEDTFPRPSRRSRLAEPIQPKRIASETVQTTTAPFRRPRTIRTPSAAGFEHGH